jgi:hypothetical protein
VHAEQGDRHPLRHLQLEMAQVVDAERAQRERRCRDPRREASPAEPAHQQVRAQPAQHEAGEEDEVVHHGRMDPGPEQRRPGQSGQKHRVRIGQRCLQRIEDVGVEEVPRAGDDLVRHPPHPPHREDRIAAVGNRIEIAGLLVQHEQRQRRHRQHHGGELRRLRHAQF